MRRAEHRTRHPEPSRREDPPDRVIRGLKQLGNTGGEPVGDEHGLCVQEVPTGRAAPDDRLTADHGLARLDLERTRSNREDHGLREHIGVDGFAGHPLEKGSDRALRP
jgi:hypothetical protein